MNQTIDKRLAFQLNTEQIVKYLSANHVFLLVTFQMLPSLSHKSQHTSCLIKDWYTSNRVLNIQINIILQLTSGFVLSRLFDVNPSLFYLYCQFRCCVVFYFSCRLLLLLLVFNVLIYINLLYFHIYFTFILD